MTENIVVIDCMIKNEIGSLKPYNNYFYIANIKDIVPISRVNSNTYYGPDAVTERKSIAYRHSTSKD